MSGAPPVGSESDPIITDTVPVGAGTAIVIGAAASAIVLCQAVIRSWRRVSLAQGRGLALAAMHSLVFVLCATAAIGASGAFHFFEEDARAMGGLLPVIGVLAPFVFLVRRPDDGLGRAAKPTRARFLSWVRESPINAVILFPGLALSALCVWGMVEAKSWDVLALAVSIGVAVITTSDPPLYYAWDGIGPEWQWGRLLPCPSRMPSWRFVVGRVEDEDGEVGVEIDAMEMPVVDSRLMLGSLLGEDVRVSDRSLAVELKSKGVHRAMPHFYEYVETVWAEIIHGTANGKASQGRLFDEAVASSVLLVLNMLKDSLDSKVAIGADVWLLLAILSHRVTEISGDYVAANTWEVASKSRRVASLSSSVLGAMSGRQRGQTLVVNDDMLAALEAGDAEGDDSGAENDDTVDAENAPGADNGVASRGDATSPPGTGNADARADSGAERSERYTLEMFQALTLADNPPQRSDVSEWVQWVLLVLQDLYSSALSVSSQDTNVLGPQQVRGMDQSFREWLGHPAYAELSECLKTALTVEARPALEDAFFTSSELRDAESQGEMSRVEEATTKVAEDECWVYCLLVMASEYIVTVGRNTDMAIGFESAGVDVSSGEMNGRLKAQNMARKIVLAQVGLWGYVALGQTAAALLRG